MALIGDAVIHAYNLTPGNRARAASEEEFGIVRDMMAGIHQLWSDPGYVCPPDAYLGTWNADELASAVFFESETDFAVYHEVPLFPVFKDGGSQLSAGIELKERFPGRVYLYGGVDATLPTDRAIERMDWLNEAVGVVGFKFYPVTGLYDEYGRADGVLFDDIERMYPLLRHADTIGVRHVAMHKAVPFRLEPMDPFLNVNDYSPAAVAFPNITFEVVHSGMAFLEETSSLIARHPNVYANLEITMNLIVRFPRRFARILGTMLSMAPPEKIMYGTGCMLTHTRPIIEAFRDFEMPKDLVEEEGVPPLDDAMKDKILGGNLLALLGLDEATVRAQVAGDEVDAFRREHGLAAPWSRIPVGV